MDVGVRFHSFEELQNAVDVFCKQNNILLTRNDCKTAEAANKRLSENADRFPEDLKYAYIQYACKHFGTGRSRATGARPNQR